MGGRQFQPELFKRWLQTSLCHLLCTSLNSWLKTRVLVCAPNISVDLCCSRALFRKGLRFSADLGSQEVRDALFVAQERETFVGSFVGWWMLGIACVLWLRDRSGTGPREWKQIMMDYSGQTCLCRDCSCSNRSLQTVSEVVPTAAPLP